MSRPHLHSSVHVTWAIANREASLAGAVEIEPIHLLVALLQILDDAALQEAARLNLTAEDISEVEALAREGRQLIGIPSEEITTLRRAAQRSLRASEVGEARGQLHRSPQSKRIFALADDLARQEQRPDTTLLHLLQATMTFPDSEVARLLEGRVKAKPDLTWETRVHRFADQFDLGRITILMSDIEGSMSLKARYGDRESAKIFRAHENLFREELSTASGGSEIKVMGDGFLLAFRSEEEAVRFALRVQSLLRTHPHLSSVRVKVRIGIHSGEILSRVVPGSTLSDPIFGITIDTASRISSLAVGNQILMSREVRDAAHDEVASGLPDGVGAVEWRSYGEYSVKGLETPLEIFEVGEVGKAAFTTPAGSDKATPAGNGATPSPAPSVLTAASRTPSLDLFGRDLTQLAREDRLAPVVGRREEIRALARHLQRTTKRNVIVVGDAGVGKTAVVEGFAQWVVSGAAQEPFNRLRVVQISVADLVAGAKYRGDMEERVRGILEDVTSNPEVVLFLDEVHLAVGSGSSGEGSLDLANILKPALARDDFRCIGATTTEEFERHIKGDSAFMRRFQLLRVPEPTREEAREICRRWAERIKDVQDVTVTQDAIDAAVRLSADLIRGRALPDKAIDLLDNAATLVKISTLSARPVAPRKELPVVGAAEVEMALEEQYGIPADSAKGFDPELIRSALLERLVGQREAVESLVEALRASGRRTSESRPTAVLLFTGPTGVGKTYTAECLAEALFGIESGALCRLNMSEFKERHELARLIGAPPGFVGHEQAGALFSYIEGHPQGLVLLDEMEKAHSEIQDYFLQLFDKGEARDSRGRNADFRRQIFVMTCNVLGTDQGSPRLGFLTDTERGDLARGGEAGRAGSAPLAALREELLRHFRREFLARLDQVIEFRPLDMPDFRALLDRRISSLSERLSAESQVVLNVTERAKEHVCQVCLEQNEGVRSLDRGFERLIGSLVYEHIEESSTGRRLVIDFTGGELVCVPE